MKVGNETKMCVEIYEWIKHHTDLEKHFFHFPLEGKRGYQNWQMLERMGTKADVSDILISKSNATYCGLWIEVKDAGKKPNKGQLSFMNQMIEDGYWATWSDNVDDIKIIITKFYQNTLNTAFS
jgi:hypothetical protein